MASALPLGMEPAELGTLLARSREAGVAGFRRVLADAHELQSRGVAPRPTGAQSLGGGEKVGVGVLQ